MVKPVLVGRSGPVFNCKPAWWCHRGPSASLISGTTKSLRIAVARRHGELGEFHRGAQCKFWFRCFINFNASMCSQHSPRNAWTMSLPFGWELSFLWRHRAGVKCWWWNATGWVARASHVPWTNAAIHPTSSTHRWLTPYLHPQTHSHRHASEPTWHLKIAMTISIGTLFVMDFHQD